MNWWHKFEWFCMRFIGVILVDGLLSDKPYKLIEGIEVHYSDSSWLQEIEEILRMLREEDPWHYRIVKKRLVYIAQLDEPALSKNRKGPVLRASFCGAFFDRFTSEERADMGPRRYAAVLVGFATVIELIERFKIYAAWNPRRRSYDRIRRIQAKAELSCSEKLNCEMKHIYDIQQWMRNN